MSDDGLAEADGVAVFVAVEFHIDVRGLAGQQGSELLADLLAEWGQPGTLEEDGDVGVADAIAGGVYLGHDVDKENRAVGVFPFWVGWGKELADVALAQRAEDRIDERVDRHIAIAVRDGGLIGGDDDAAENQFAAGLEAVDVVAVADAGGFHV